jgi:peptidoglycan/xylan/chitin deacetylase (PgdA/CDA1 family)
MDLASLFPVIHQVLKPTFPECLWSGCDKTPAIALTFDDGPHPHYTPALLKVLDRYQIHASFFWLGACVDKSPELAREMYDRGHWIGLHSYDHRSFTSLSTNELHQTLYRTQEAIASACDLDLEDVRQRMRDVRPPNGLFTPRTLQLLKLWDYRPVMWSVVPEDWVRPGVGVVTRRVLNQTMNGSLIVLHDGHYGGEDVAATAAQLIPALLDQGYQFISVDQLWERSLPGGALASP